MITLPDNYEEIIAEALREMAANTARIIAAEMKQQAQDPYARQEQRNRTASDAAKKRAAPTTPRQGGAYAGNRNGTNL